MKRIMCKLLLPLLAIISVVVLTGCYSHTRAIYYSDTTNYIEATGVITYIEYTSDKKELYIECEDLSYKFDDNCFKLVGDSLLITQENGIDEKITIGCEVSFVTAPKYFGDGYVMPIVALSVQDDVLLDFSQGYPSWLEWLKNE